VLQNGGHRLLVGHLAADHRVGEGLHDDAGDELKLVVVLRECLELADLVHETAAGLLIAATNLVELDPGVARRPGALVPVPDEDVVVLVVERRNQIDRELVVGERQLQRLPGRLLSGVELDLRPARLDRRLEPFHDLARAVRAAQLLPERLRQQANDVDVLERLEHRLAGEGALQEAARDEPGGRQFLTDRVVPLLRVAADGGVEVEVVVEGRERGVNGALHVVLLLVERGAVRRRGRLAALP